MNVDLESLIDISGVKPGQRAILKNGRAILVGKGGVNTADNFTTGVIVDVSGTLMVQPLIYEGNSPKNDGQPISVDKFYAFETGMSPAEYDIDRNALVLYKCVSIEDPTWSGYKGYFENNQITFSNSITSGLAISGLQPEINGIYTANTSHQLLMESDINNKANAVLSNLFESSTVTAEDVLSGKYFIDNDPESGAILKEGTYVPIEGVDIDSAVIAGYAINTNGELTFQDLSGSTPESISSLQIVNTGVSEPEYSTSGTSSGGSMDIYKCVDADGMTWWTISGCGSTEANGKYYRGDDIFMYGQYYPVFYQYNGNCFITYDYDWAVWALKSSSNELYRDYSANWDNSDPSTFTGWSIEPGMSFGVEPFPSITKETINGNGWKGKKYDMETGEVADTVTDLTYTAQMPEIGKLYTYDATFQITVKSGLLLYAPCAEYGKEIKYWSNGNTARMNYTNISEANFTTLKGVPCLLGTGSQTAYAKISFSNMTSFTASCMFYSTQNQSTYQTPAGLGTFENGTLNPIHFAVHYPSGKYYIGDGLRDPYDEFYFDLLLETWTHVTVVVNVDGTYRMYINGVLQDSGVKFYTSTRQFEYLVLLALTQTATTSGTKYKGAVAEVKLWGKALTAEEIKAEADRCLAMVIE